jgi:hypothetical protein
LPDGSPAILFTTRSYSQSTSSHISKTRQACSHLPIYLVEHPNLNPSASDVDDLLAKAQIDMDKARRARTRAAWYIDTAAGLIERANRLIVAFGLPRAQTSLDTLAPNLAEIRRKAAEDAAAAHAKRVADQLQARLDWQAGHSHRFYGTDEHGNAYMRIHQDRLETSQGASVPLDDAKRVFEMVARCRAASTAWIPRDDKRLVRVGDFTVDRIEPTGDFVAGCHRFSWTEVQRVAASIGLTA